MGAGRAGCRQPVCLRKGGSECEMSQAPGRRADLSPLRSQSHSRRIPPSPTSTFDRQHKSPKGALTGSRPHEGERLASSKRRHVLRASVSTGRDGAQVNTQLLGLGVRVCAALHCTGLTGGRKLGSICHLSCGASSTATVWARI